MKKINPMITEAEIQDAITGEAPKYGGLLMRNNSGGFRNPNGQPVRFGLGNISKEHNKRSKSSDLIGITPVLITPEMVGRTLGVFTAIEVKEKIWKRNVNDNDENAQDAFIQWVKSKGGIAGFANSIDSFLAIIRSF